MNRVEIFTDSTLNLSSELVEKYIVVPCMFLWGKQLSGRNRNDNRRLCRQINERQIMPKTAAPSTAIL